MTDTEMHGQSNVAVVGAAVAVAGVLGTAVMALLSRKNSRTAQERLVDRVLEERDNAEAQLSSAQAYSDQLLNVLQSRASEAGQVARGKAGKAQHGVHDAIAGADTKNVKKAWKRARKQAPKDATSARKRFSGAAEHAADELPDRIQDLGDDVLHLGEEVVHRGQDLAGNVLDHAPELRKQLKSARKQWQPALEDAADAAAEALLSGRNRVVKAVDQSDFDVDHVRKRARSASDQLQEAAEEGRKRAEKELLPTLRHAADEAKHRIDEGRKKAESDYLPAIRHATDDARKRAEKDLLPALRDTADELRERAESDVLPRLRDVSEDLRHRADDAREYAQTDLRDDLSESTEKARKQVQRSSGQLHDVGDHVSHAAEAVADGGRNTGAFAAWVGIGAGIVYVAFLNDEQRTKVRDLTSRATSEAREIYRDIQGNDERFE